MSSEPEYSECGNSLSEYWYQTMPCAKPVLTVHLFPGLLHQLIDVLEALTPEEWDLPTPCPGWSVHDLAAHILGDEVGQLSMGRDDYHASLIAASDWAGLVRGLNDLNEQWVTAMKRLSPRLMIDLMKSTGEQVNLYLQSLDPHSTGPVVSWAGPGPAPTWLHIAREYTERWHHQQQIREAIGRPLLTDPNWFSPVLATFVHGLPRSYSGVKASGGTKVRVMIAGASGGTWVVMRTHSGWVLCEDELGEPAAQFTIGEIDAWKLFTKSMPRDVAQSKVEVEGDVELALKALNTVSVIA